jgi:hypothetical protein
MVVAMIFLWRSSAANNSAENAGVRRAEQTYIQQARLEDDPLLRSFQLPATSARFFSTAKPTLR